jgi:DNA-binding response OmpR family regulator
MSGSPIEEARTRVLIADDEERIAETLELILNQSGFRAFAVFDGNAAVETARSWRPDILLSDVAMPYLDGFGAARRVVAMYPKCRVILLSAYSEAADGVRDLYEDGFQIEFIAKPIHPRELIAQLKQVPSERHLSATSRFAPDFPFRCWSGDNV